MYSTQALSLGTPVPKQMWPHNFNLHLRVLTERKDAFTYLTTPNGRPIMTVSNEHVSGALFDVLSRRLPGETE
jgi:hypothetical protein